MVIEQRRTDQGSIDRILGELITEVRVLRDKVEKLDRSVDSLNEAKNKGIGILSLIMFIAGGAGAIVSTVLHHFIGKQ